MSDRPDALPDLETRMGDVAAVMDAARPSEPSLRVLRGRAYVDSLRGQPPRPGAGTHPLLQLRATAVGARLPVGVPPRRAARYAAQLEQDWAWEADMRHMCPNADDELARWWGERAARRRARVRRVPSSR